MKKKLLWCLKTKNDVYFFFLRNCCRIRGDAIMMPLVVECEAETPFNSTSYKYMSCSFFCRSELISEAQIDGQLTLSKGNCAAAKTLAAPQTHQLLLRPHGAVAAVTRLSVLWRSRHQRPVQKAGAVVPPHLQVNLALASNLSVARQRPLLQALRAPELPDHPVQLEHVLDDGFPLWAHPAVKELLLQQQEVLLDPLQALVEVKVDSLPRVLGFFGLSGPPVFALDHGPPGDAERSDGGEQQPLVALGAGQEACELRQRHFSSGENDALLKVKTQRQETDFFLHKNRP